MIVIKKDMLVTESKRLDEAKILKVAALSKSCEQEIISGFEFDVLGSAHLYPTKATDQQNLSSAVLQSMTEGLAQDWNTPIWCCDGSGVWDMRPHTASQVQDVGRGVSQSILALMTRNKDLAGQVRAAVSLEGVDKITWHEN